MGFFGIQFNQHVRAIAETAASVLNLSKAVADRWLRPPTAAASGFRSPEIVISRKPPLAQFSRSPCDRDNDDNVHGSTRRLGRGSTRRGLRSSTVGGSTRRHRPACTLVGH